MKCDYECMTLKEMASYMYPRLLTILSTHPHKGNDSSIKKYDEASIKIIYTSS